MTGSSILDLAALIVGGIMLFEKVWKYRMVARFFAACSRTSENEPIPESSRPQEEQVDRPEVSILQPILSGDPTLARCLEHNLRFRSRYTREMLWLVDEDDMAGQAI